MMITAGIDAGLEETKAVILGDGAILGKAKIATGGADRSRNIEEVYQEALTDAKLAAGDVEKVVATGKGKYEALGAAALVSEQTAAAKAAKFFCQAATFVVSVGADETMSASLGEERLLQEYAFNMKCSAGLGLFLSSLADRLGMSLEEFSALDDPQGEAINDGCVVFGELDVLSLLNRGVAREAVGAAAIKAATVRASAVINDVTAADKACVVLVGGLTKNAAFVSGLSAFSGIDFVVPANAEYAGAIGAALAAMS